MGNQGMKKLAIFTALAFLSAGCAPVISKELREQVEKDLTFKEVIQDPEAYEGRVVLWGGVIVSSKNLKEGTLIEVLQTPITRQGKPKDKDRSDGRFLALHEGYLDTAVYAEGRDVTLAGEIKGKKVQPLGEIKYTYPLISAREIYLWPQEAKERYYPDPYWGYPYYPWWWHHPRHPYWGPWW